MVSEDISSKVPEQEIEQDFEKWDYGHLIRECFRCGHKTIMDKDVADGVSLYLPTTDKHELKLVCEQCGMAISMYFIKSDKVKPPKELDEEKPVEIIEEKRKRKRIKKTELNATQSIDYEVSKGSQKEKFVSTDSTSS